MLNFCFHFSLRGSYLNEHKPGEAPKQRVCCSGDAPPVIPAPMAITLLPAPGYLLLITGANQLDGQDASQKHKGFEIPFPSSGKPFLGASVCPRAQRSGLCLVPRAPQ